MSPAGEGVYDLLVSYRSGDMWAPQIEQSEALRDGARLLRRCITTGQDARSTMASLACGWCKMLEAASESLEKEERWSPVNDRESCNASRTWITTCASRPT